MSLPLLLLLSPPPLLSLLPPAHPPPLSPLPCQPPLPFQVRITAVDTALLSSRGHRQFQSVRAVAEVGMRLRGLAQRIGMALAFDSLEVSHDDFSVLSRVSGW